MGREVQSMGVKKKKFQWYCTVGSCLEPTSSKKEPRVLRDINPTITNSKNKVAFAASRCFQKFQTTLNIWGPHIFCEKDRFYFTPKSCSLQSTWSEVEIIVYLGGCGEWTPSRMGWDLWLAEPLPLLPYFNLETHGKECDRRPQDGGVDFWVETGWFSF